MIGEYIRSLRKKQRMSIARLAQLSGVSDSYLCQLESGKKRRPSVDILVGLSKALSVPFSMLLQEAYDIGTPETPLPRSVYDDGLKCLENWKEADAIRELAQMQVRLLLDIRGLFCALGKTDETL